MFLSMNWISDFVDLSGLDKIALIKNFTLATAEVEDIIVKGGDTHGVVAAKIESVEEHPSSKKLHLLKINDGRGILIDCVCGAPNVREGMHVAFAREGGMVSGREIGRATIAGYESCGMCCSEAELGISDDHSGLMEIDESIALGTDLKQVFDIDDIVFEVDNKSLTNRPDLWGHYGIAREFAAISGRSLKPLEKTDLSKYANLPEVEVNVKDKELVFRYCAMKVDSITRKTSPVNMRIRLYYCGSRAINLLADLTNYVMMELGQPMHAFDCRKVDHVEIQRFEEPFTFRTLDGIDRRMDSTNLMITSSDVPVAIAGVMGGDASKIEDDTDSLLLESATFDGVSVRKTSTKIGLRTDASMRYEKMLDPELCETATARLLLLLLSLDPGAKVRSAFTDRYVRKYPEIKIDIDKSYIDRYTGIEISDDRVVSILKSLGFGVETRGKTFSVSVPSWRATKDVTIKADLVEEITRIYGYDNFEVKTSLSPLRPVKAERAQTDTSRIKDILVGAHRLHEVHSYIWSDIAKDKELGIETVPNVTVINAQTPDHRYLRVSMIPTLLAFVSENKGFADDFGIFEAGHVVEGLRKDGTADERRHLGATLYSKVCGEEELFFRARDIIDDIFATVKHVLPEYVRCDASADYAHPGNTFEIVCGGKEMGTLSVLHPRVRNLLDKRASVAFFELDLEGFSAIAPKDIRYSEPSKFPGIDIDMTFAAPIADISVRALENAARRAGGDTLSDFRIHDIYSGADGDTVTVRLTFVSNERTLSKTEIQPYTDAIVAEYAKLGYTMRA